MESTLHRQLKTLYGGSTGATEVTLDGFRIDVVAGGELVEIQFGPLAAIREKVRRLVQQHTVRVVKPLVQRRFLVYHRRRGGPVVRRRWSPKRGQLLDLFHDLVHFTRVFPHARLTLEVPLVEVEEWRYPGHGRRRRWRDKDYLIEDRHLREVFETVSLHQAHDVLRLLPTALPFTFHTGQLAELLTIDRWVAQRIAYCLRQMGVVEEIGKQHNARIYRLAAA